MILLKRCEVCGVWLFPWNGFTSGGRIYLSGMMLYKKKVKLCGGRCASIYKKDPGYQTRKYFSW